MAYKSDSNHQLPHEMTDQHAEFYRAFFEEAPDMFASVDAHDATIKACNQTLADTLGYAKADVIGRSIHDLYHPDSHDLVNEVFEAFVESGQAQCPHLRLIKANGEILDVSLRVSSTRDEAGNVISSRSIWRDISSDIEIEKLELELRLQTAQKMESLGLLAGGIAHDFNNLLVSILGNASLAVQQLPKESPAVDKLMVIETAAQRAADLTKQLLAYSGTQSFPQDTFNLSSVVEEMGHLMQVAISRKVVLNFDFASEDVPVIGDVTQIRQIILNLLTNGSDAIGERSGMITVRTGLQDVTEDFINSSLLPTECDPGCFAYLEISDTGVGISHQHQKKIFDPFYSTKTKGHGLGLAAVLGIVRSHRGTLRIYSEVGNGTTIKVLIPSTIYTDSKAPADAHARRAQGERILVVDDEEHVCATTKQILEHYGFGVSLCADGREAVDYYTQYADEIDLVLMDITMPHLDGIAAFKEIVAFDEDARIVLMSGYNEQHAMNALTGRSFVGFLQKPFLPDNLVQTIVKALDHA